MQERRPPILLTHPVSALHRLDDHDDDHHHHDHGHDYDDNGHYSLCGILLTSPVSVTKEGDDSSDI